VPADLDDEEEGEEEEEDDEEEEEREDEDGDIGRQKRKKNRKKRQKKKKKKNKKKKKSGKDINRLAQAQQYSCRKPLVEIDMVGCWFRLAQRIYGLCVYCGRLTDVLNVNMTNLGLSCGQHALASEYPDYHRLWLSLGRTRQTVIETLTLHNRNLYRRTRPHCAACDAPNAEREIDVYDFHRRRFRIALCSTHVKRLGALIPVQNAGTLVGSPTSPASPFFYESENGSRKHRAQLSRDPFGLFKQPGPRVTIDGVEVVARAPPLRIDVVANALMPYV
jgi:hypothetical protein